jgi:fermentation-respiration switch protein FrsA (DUF1100 family)
MSKKVAKSLEPYKDIIDRGNNWINKQLLQDIYIKTKDKIVLHGTLIKNKNSKGIFLEVPGYRSTPDRDLYPSCHEYYNMGYSILLIDNRSSGKSTGKYITFGIKESQDIVLWIRHLNRLYPNKNIILAGVSMGATSILMSLKRIKKNMNVKLALVDSPFIYPYEEVLYCIKHYFHINGRLLIDMINLWSIIIAKYNLKEENTISCLKRTNIPILFVHGLDDDFVLPKNSIINYKKYNGPKELQLFEKATHGISYLVNPTKYVKAIKEFISKYN